MNEMEILEIQIKNLENAYTNIIEALNNLNDIEGLEFKGSKPSKGSMTVRKDGKVSMAISNGKYCVTKGFEDEDVMMIADNGIIIRTPAKDISIIGRDTVGVKVMRLKDGAKVMCVAIADHIAEDMTDDGDLHEDIEINETDPDKFVEIVKAIAPTFGGINLEDIAAPRCFEIERKLKEKLDIPFLFLAGGECHILRRIGGELGCCTYLCVHEYDELATPVQPLLKNVKANQLNCPPL